MITRRALLLLLAAAPILALASLTSPASCRTNGPSGAVALELGDDGGAVGAASTAGEPQAMTARATEIPRNASLIRDPVSPEVDISMSAP